MLYRICRLAPDFTSPNHKEKTDFKKSSYSHQGSMVLAQRQKYRSMEQNRKPRDNSTYLGIPYI